MIIDINSINNKNSDNKLEKVKIIKQEAKKEFDCYDNLLDNFMNNIKELSLFFPFEDLISSFLEETKRLAKNLYEGNNEMMGISDEDFTEIRKNMLTSLLNKVDNK